YFSIHLSSASFLSLFFLPLPLPPISILFPYTTLFRSMFPIWIIIYDKHIIVNCFRLLLQIIVYLVVQCNLIIQGSENRNNSFLLDRKSTRLNSSHVSISYAVFCLKKKKIFTHYIILLS